MFRKVYQVMSVALTKSYYQNLAAQIENSVIAKLIELCTKMAIRVIPSVVANLFYEVLT